MTETNEADQVGTLNLVESSMQIRVSTSDDAGIKMVSLSVVGHQATFNLTLLPPEAHGLAELLLRALERGGHGRARIVFDREGGV
jgi:hypothetical protein